MIQITMIYILTYLIYKRRQTQFIKIHDSITFFSCFTFLQDPLFSTLGFVAAITLFLDSILNSGSGIEDSKVEILKQIVK